MWKGGEVVEVSDGDDGDFEPLPLRPSQQVRPGKRKASGGPYLKESPTKKPPSKTSPVKRSPYFATPNTAPVKSVRAPKLQGASLPSTPLDLTQRRVSDMFTSASSSARSEEAKSTPVLALGSQKEAPVLGDRKKHEEEDVATKEKTNFLRTSNVPIAERNAATEKTTSVPSSQATTRSQSVSMLGSSPANPFRIGGLVDEDDTVISSLKSRFDAEKPKTPLIETFDDVTMAAMVGNCLDFLDIDDGSLSIHDVIEGPVRVLGEPARNGSGRRQLRKAVDRVLDDVGTGSCTWRRDTENGASPGRSEDKISQDFTQEDHLGYKNINPFPRESRSASKGNADSRAVLEKLENLRRERIGKRSHSRESLSAANIGRPDENGAVHYNNMSNHGHNATSMSGRSVVRDVKNSTETSAYMDSGSTDHASGRRTQIANTTSMSARKLKSDFSRSPTGLEDVHDEIDKEHLWEEEFASFANRKPRRTSLSGQPNATAALEALKMIANKGQILHIENIPARPAAYSDQDFKLPKKLQKAVQERGITKFYSHQGEAMDAVFNGSSIVAATPTASGKSMTYIIPVLDSLMKVPKSRALFIFPVKALARDQLKTLSDLATEVKKGSHCYCYDGDTDKDHKSHIRKNGKIIITNPDMLHFGVLSNHKLWEQFFSNLKFVVLDEAHTYRGVFGSHVGCILRRLLRIARHYGSEPMFICCSATIGNPKEHVKNLTTVDMELIHGSGAPTGEKHVVCWLPPETKTGERRSVYKEAVKIVVALMKAGIQILVFVEARKLSEIVCRLVREKLIKQRRSDLVEKVDSYRAGYTPEERIALEKRLQHGQLRALVTTRALELGIDVGDLDATVHVGLPNTMCSLWQQAGRAGRRQGASLAVILGQERALDVFYMKNPRKLFGRDVEHAFCNPCNPQVLRLQLPCAARELPLRGDDEEYFGEAFEKARDDLVSQGVLQYRAGLKGESLYGYRYDDNPAHEISIRGTSTDCFQLLTGANTVVEQVDGKMALRMLYEGAIYPHARDTYRIKSLDIEKRQAFGELCDVHHITEVNAKTSVIILEKTASRTTLGTRIHLGKLQVKEQVMGYTEIDVVKNKVVDSVTLKYPPSVFDTIGLWWDIPPEVMQRLKHMVYDALLVLRRVVLSLLPSMTMSDPTDILGLEMLVHEQTEQPQIFIYDAYPGGIGLAEQAYKDVEEVWTRALNVLQSCDCKFGCPACTQSAHDTITSEASSSKHASITLLEALLCTRQQTPTTPAPVDRFNVAAETGGGNPKTQDKNLKSDAKCVVKAAALYSGTTRSGYKKGPYVSSKASAKGRLVPKTAGTAGGQVVIDLS